MAHLLYSPILIGAQKLKGNRQIFFICRPFPAQ